MDIFGIAITAIIASGAWLYQKAWERQERRTLRYQEIIDRLPAFTETHINPAEINLAIKEVHRLWLFAPDSVVEACEKILDYAEGRLKGVDPDLIVGECILQMRRDASYWRSIFPRFWWTKLPSSRFKLRSAKISNPNSSVLIRSFESKKSS